LFKKFIFYFIKLKTHDWITDKDADETLTWEEYSLIPSESLLVRYSENKRKEEFNNFIDRNRDGKLDKREILVSYMQFWIDLFETRSV
jgi:hypothetical protein